jgi:hypothetical protein
VAGARGRPEQYAAQAGVGLGRVGGIDDLAGAAHVVALPGCYQEQAAAGPAGEPGGGGGRGPGEGGRQMGAAGRAAARSCAALVALFVCILLPARPRRHPAIRYSSGLNPLGRWR